MISKGEIIKERDLLKRWAEAMSKDIKYLQNKAIKDIKENKITAAEWRGKILRLRAM